MKSLKLKKGSMFVLLIHETQKNMKITVFPPIGKPKNFNCEKAMFIDGKLWLEMTAQQHKHFTNELDGLYLLIYDLLPKENQNVQFSICSPMSRVELYSTDF